MITENIHRRALLTRITRTSLVLGAPAALVPQLAAIDYNKPVPGSENLTAYLNGGQAIFRWNNRILCSYRAVEGQKYPYFYPLAGPVSGCSVTTESALPYPHHRGLWLGWQPVNGGDYWGDGTLDDGHQRSTALTLGPATPKSAALSGRCEWVRKDAPSPLEDERKFTITVEGPDVWWIDADITLRARQDITVKSAKHSLFAIRAAADISPIYGGVIENSEGGRGADGTYGKTARWCGYHGKRAVPGNIVEGIAVMDHPANPWAPCPWLTRDYGHLSPSPFNFLKKPWSIAKGQSLRLRYRVVVHAGTPKEAGMERIYKDFVSAGA